MKRSAKPGESVTAELHKGEEREYRYNLPWTGVWLGAVINSLFAFAVGWLARNQTGPVHAVLMILSSLFILLALMGLARRVFFPRVLRLDENAIYFPRGFSASRANRIRYADIVRVIESNRQRISLHLMTNGRQFWIDAPSLGSPRNYIAVRAMILERASISTSSASANVPDSGKWRELPEPILHSVEPAEWPRYRSHLVTSSPLAPRAAWILWFFVKCFGIIIIPWIILRLCGLAGSPLSYLPLAATVSFLFTVLRWYGAIHPASQKALTFRAHGITLRYGKQFADYYYEDLVGWNIVQRSFDGQTLDVLLLRVRKWEVAFAFPDTETRDRTTQILREKGVVTNDILVGKHSLILSGVEEQWNELAPGVTRWLAGRTDFG